MWGSALARQLLKDVLMNYRVHEGEKINLENRSRNPKK
jgi:hypothetical protein